MTRPATILVLTAGGPYPWIVINALALAFPSVEVLVEAPESRALFLRRRARKVGWLQTAGQFATMTLSRFGKRCVRAREADLILRHGLATEPAPGIPITHVPSANSSECLAAIAGARPAVVLLAGCRMLSRATLAAIPCPVINYHAGINPKYRGVQGGYWARALGDPGNYGTTVHLVDAGVDTGAVLYQAFITPDPAETLLTDAMAQAAGSRDIVIAAVRDALDGRLSPQPVDLPSVQRFHPPIWTWIGNGLSRGTW
ncbi:formyl transferase [Hoeflea marina]|nr:formyl transferase [Hoeflea marina]